MSSRLNPFTILGFCILILTGCNQSNCSSTCGCGDAPTSNEIVISSLSANFIIPSENEYADLHDPILANLNEAHKPADVYLTIATGLSYLESKAFAVTFSLFKAANACSPAPNSITDPIQNIRVFMYNSSNANITSGIELTDQLTIERAPEYEALGNSLEQWNAINNKNIWARTFKLGVVSVSFLKPENIQPGTYSYYIMATTKDGDLWETYTEEITFN